MISNRYSWMPLFSTNRAPQVYQARLRRRHPCLDRNFLPLLECLEGRHMLAGYFIVGAMNTSVAEPPNAQTTIYADFAISLQSWDGSGGQVSWAALSGPGDTATAGSDYEALSGTVSLGPGHNSETIQIPILYDTVTEFDESFRVVLSSPSSGFSIMQGTAIVTIAATPPTYVSILAGSPGSGSGNETQVLEGATNQFRVTRSQNDASLQVYLGIDSASTVNSTDYSAS
ncbi:MAG: Calx-beta domain-containing protein [Pirellulaceae bacterium]